jgi:hypothetical protein
LLRFVGKMGRKEGALQYGDGGSIQGLDTKMRSLCPGSNPRGNSDKNGLRMWINFEPENRREYRKAVWETLKFNSA